MSSSLTPIPGNVMFEKYIYFSPSTSSSESHINKKTQYERPLDTAARPDWEGNGMGRGGGLSKGAPPKRGRAVDTSFSRSKWAFTRDVNQLHGQFITTKIFKGPKGLGFTLIGNDSTSRGDEFIQVKSILPGGAAAANGVLQPGDILVQVNGVNMLGATQTDACRTFVASPVGKEVEIQVCRGYPLLLDPSNTIITENVYSTVGRAGGSNRDLHEIEICKGRDGFGFTIADSINGQRVKKVLFPSQCPNLLEGDVIVELDGRDVRHVGHTQLVDILRECPLGHTGVLLVRRSSPKHSRSRTPTAAFRYGEQRGTTPAPSVAPRSKTPAPQSRNQPEPSIPFYPRNGIGTLTRQPERTAVDGPADSTEDNGGFYSGVATRNAPSRMRPSSTSLGFASTPNYMPIQAFRSDRQSDYVIVNLIRKPNGFGFRLLGGTESGTPLSVGQIVQGGAAADDGRLIEGDEIMEIDGCRVEGATHAEAVSLLEAAAHAKHVKLVVRRSRQHIERDGEETVSHGQLARCQLARSLSTETRGGNCRHLMLHRNEGEGFGFIIISSLNRDGSTIGQIVDGSPAARCGQLRVGDRVIAVNQHDIRSLTHGEIVNLIKQSGLSVKLTIAEAAASPQTPHSNDHGVESNTYRVNGSRSSDAGQLLEVELARGAKGFGFSIRGGQEFGAMPLFVLRMAEEGPATRDGRMRVGDELVAINGTLTAGLTHEEAITLIKQYPTVRLTLRRRQIP